MKLPEDFDPNKHQVRIYWTGGLMCTSNDIKMLKFDLEMKEHYRQEKEADELQMHILKLEAEFYRSRSVFAFFNLFRRFL